MRPIEITQEIVLQYQLDCNKLAIFLNHLEKLQIIAQKSVNDGIIPIRVERIETLSITDSPVPNFKITVYLNPTRIFLNLVYCKTEKAEDAAQELQNLFAALNANKCTLATTPENQDDD